MKKIILSACILTSALILLSCAKKPSLAEQAEAEEILYAVTAKKLSVGTLDDYLEFGGDVDSVSSVSVMPDMAGKLSGVKVSVGDMVKKDVIVIDAGYTLENKKICGDVDFDSVSKKASIITKQPGGMGPLIVSMFLKNILMCYNSKK